MLNFPKKVDERVLDPPKVVHFWRIWQGTAGALESPQYTGWVVHRFETSIHCTGNQKSPFPFKGGGREQEKKHMACYDKFS